MTRSKLVGVVLLVIVSTLLMQNALSADGYWAFDNITRDQGGRNDVSTTWKVISDTSVAGKTTWKWDPSPNACGQTIESIFSWNVPETMETAKPYNLTVKLDQITNNDCLSVSSWLKMYIGVTDSTTNSDGPSISFGNGNGLVGEKTSEVYGPIHYPKGKCYILVHCMMYQEWYDVKYWYNWVEGTPPEKVEPGANSVIHASTWIVKEYGPMGNYDGLWTRRPGTNTFDASWGSITDVIDITSVEGNEITLHRHGNDGNYTGTISPDGLSISGTASWYTSGETWVVSISSPGTGISPLPQPQVTPASSTTAGAETPVSDTFTGTLLGNGAFILNANEEYEKAERICNRALELDPGNPYVLSMKGWALIGLGRNEEALNIIDQALAINPNDDLALRNRAYCLINLGRCPEAAEVVAKLDSMATSDFEKYMNQKIISSCGQNS